MLKLIFKLCKYMAIVLYFSIDEMTLGPASVVVLIDDILPKGPYPPWLRMTDRALLAGYPRYHEYRMLNIAQSDSRYGHVVNRYCVRQDRTADPVEIDFEREDFTYLA